jgi:hypothetical protein
MKKYLLSALVGLSAIGMTNKGQAQSFTPFADTVRYTVYGDANVNDNITNTTSSPIRITWRVISHNIPTDWQNGFGMCDNITCYSNSILSGATRTTDTFSHTCDFHVQINLESASSGNYYITAELKDAGGSFMDTATFIINKWPTGVTGVTKTTDNVVLYPMPAHNELNILFEANTGAKNVAICNLIGKVVDTYRVAGSSASLDISNIPSGVYFTRISDGQGKIITTRKFIKQ